ncbi:ABC transporter ATP-binding protein [Salinimicrobium marinum]|uniref:ABC transporter ATP-binding protein n=1 Tax=Salinimicrobium marinum TaxID=680283 RepID=UPI001E2E1733|nr:ABC transporter ATP-binding protein [Salinimicrobium marinum]
MLKLVVQDEVSRDGFIAEFVLEVLDMQLTLPNILILIFAFFSLKGLAKFFEGYLRVLYQQYFMRRIRISNIDLLSGFKFESFAKMDAGRIQNTFSGEVGRVSHAFQIFFKSFQYGVLVIIYIILAFSADPIFSLMVTVGGLCIHFVFKSFYSRTRFLSNRFTAQAHVFEGLLIQKVTFFNYLRTTGLSLMYGEKLKSKIVELEKDQRRIGLIDSFLIALREPLVISVVVIAIYLQLQFFAEDITLMFLSLLLLYRSLSYFMAMQEQWNLFLGFSGSLEGVQQFTEHLEQQQERNGKFKFNCFKDKLELENVFFKYDQTPVLRNIDLIIQKNETIAFIGESGSGKSTLMRIVSGLLLPSEGNYSIDGRPIKELELYSFRSKIGYVPQEVPIFSDSIFNNITFWAPKSPENIEKFKKAVAQASIYDFVMAQPEQEETYLGSNGINLSGGQKQRIAIARELYKEVDFLFMDEATSSLDGKTEAVVQDNIKKLKGKVTIVIIAHRLATIKSADLIVLLNNGEIAQTGSYQDLLRDSSVFRDMVKLQKG